MPKESDLAPEAYSQIDGAMYLTIVGSKNDPIAKAPFEQALGCPSNFKGLEWWDPSPGAAGRLANPDVQHPSLKVWAAFLCTGRTCSPPISKPADLQAKINSLLDSSVSSGLAQN